MKSRIITILFLGLTTFVCSGQSFLLEYPKLTKKNLSEFFLDWEAYSDSIALKAAKNDSLIDEIVRTEYAPMLLEGRLGMTGKRSHRDILCFRNTSKSKDIILMLTR